MMHSCFGFVEFSNHKYVATVKSTCLVQNKPERHIHSLFLDLIPARARTRPPFASLRMPVTPCALRS
jgi:hypothetical protein